MAIAKTALGEAPLADGGEDSGKVKTPPKRQMTAVADRRLVPEPR